MRYVIQASVMLGDVAIALAIGYAIIFGIYQGSFVLLLAAVLGIIGWHRSGLLFAWQPSNIRKFMASAKKYGL